MRKTILFLLLCISLSSYGQEAQFAQGKRPVYCEVSGWNFWGFGKVKVRIDIGDGISSLYDADGKMLKFDSMMSVLNYMGERGWRCIDNYFIGDKSEKVIRYLLEKWIKSEEEITEGILLKKDVEEKKEPYRPGKGGDDMY